MGACGSRPARRRGTAKLIFPDETLQEFSSPVKVSQILQNNPTCFVCNSDDMEFDEAVPAVTGGEALRPGQLYFVLPLAWLNHPLRPEEMAALAVKASSALANNGGGGWDENWACCEDGSFSDGDTKGERVRGNSNNTVNGGCRNGKNVKLSTVRE
ncbi:PREDICTED: uncharacterized protein LOC104819208 [Tarenaya hassleriana]|uniref:uncharacterized protein LOC104819208 n=1 Tax=Tarenaya hassleriana TaxID=28532 RepID=UPI00053C1313|nr:PREDICTED: uncharacterized protein LOC104819208 [Tarenaya hassleriana]